MAQPSITFIHDQAEGQQVQSSSQQDGVVDFKEEATIISYLMESKDELDVMSISGMAGLGKTTLAWKIFQKEEIRHKFPLRIWIRVSQKFRSRDVFLEILEKFTPQGTSSPSEEDLIHTVRACLANKDFLLVMDDVWTVQDWNEIEKILPKKNGKGKVLVTSRIKIIGRHVSLHLNTLSSGKSLELLKLKVFGNTEGCPEALEGIDQAIANKCGGVPLIIVVIGGVLKLQSPDTTPIPRLKEIWLEVLKNVNKIIQEDVDKSISNALQLSYDILPHDLRVCFLYTGVFPENHEIPASTLTQLWVAEGFIGREDVQSCEEYAQKILDALINMNLLSVGKKNLDQVKTCGVHDMVREFCQTKAKEQNLFRVMKRSAGGAIEPSVSEVENFRRLCLHSDPSKFFSENPKGPRLRSFLCFFDESFVLDERHASNIPRDFSLLRVLSCKSITFRQFPQVKRLVLLKHICLSIIENINVVIPQEISKLVNLQTLIVVTSSRSIVVKANIWKMIQLRCLKTNATISLDEMKWKGKACKNLQAISRLSPESCKPDLCERAPNLKTLGIQGKVDNFFITISLDKFHHLVKLKLVNDIDGETASSNPVNHLPQAVNFPPKLTKLTLSKTYLDWERHMPVLAQIIHLKVLKLKDKAFTGAFWRSREGNGFPNLQLLLIEDSDLVIWEASTSHFRSLTCLVLKKCKYLEKIPESLAEMLQNLEIEGVKKSAADSARKIESNRKQAQERGKVEWGAPFKLTVRNCDM